MQTAARTSLDKDRILEEYADPKGSNKDLAPVAANVGKSPREENVTVMGDYRFKDEHVVNLASMNDTDDSDEERKNKRTIFKDLNVSISSGNKRFRVDLKKFDSIPKLSSRDNPAWITAGLTVKTRRAMELEEQAGENLSGARLMADLERIEAQ